MDSSAKQRSTKVRSVDATLDGTTYPKTRDTNHKEKNTNTFNAITLTAMFVFSGVSNTYDISSHTLAYARVTPNIKLSKVFFTIYIARKWILKNTVNRYGKGSFRSTSDTSSKR